MLDNLWQIPVQIDKIGFWSTHVQLTKGRVQKKVCKITHLDGWVFQEWDKLHRKNKKKHAFKIHFRPFSVILDKLFFYPF